MYVCLCNEVTEKALRDAIKQGATTLSDLQAKLGLGNTCGECLVQATMLLDEANVIIQIHHPQIKKAISREKEPQNQARSIRSKNQSHSLISE